MNFINKKNCISNNINRMKYSFLCLLFFLFLLCNNIYALEQASNTIKLAHNAMELRDIFIEEDIKNNYLVIWDVDEVLITPTDKIFHTHNCSNNLPAKYAKEAIEKYSVSEIKAKWYGSKIVLQRNIRLVENELVAIIKDLQSNRIKTIALTKCSTGSYGAIASLEDHRIKKLQKFNINFDHAFPQYTNLVLDNINIKKSSSQYPIFKKGILFTNQYSKGEVLEAFLDKINWNPKKIVFIDDLKENLISVQKILQNKNIAYTGVLYKAAERFPSKFDEEVVKKQYEYLIENEIWLNDAEAKKLLEKN